MTTGDRTFSTKGRTVAKNTFTLIPAGTYQMILGDAADIGKADRPDAVPYVNISFEVEGTALKEGGKNRRAFHRLLLGLKEGKDGVMNMDRPSGLTALAEALGTEIEGLEIVTQEATDADGNSVTLEYLNPRQVVEWVKGFAGSQVKGRIKVQKGSGDYGDKNEVAAFMKSDS